MRVYRCTLQTVIQIIFIQQDCHYLEQGINKLSGRCYLLTSPPTSTLPPEEEKKDEKGERLTMTKIMKKRSPGTPKFLSCQAEAGTCCLLKLFLWSQVL